MYEPSSLISSSSRDMIIHPGSSVYLMSLLSTLSFLHSSFSADVYLYELFFLFLRRPRATGVTSTGL